MDIAYTDATYPQGYDANGNLRVRVTVPLNPSQSECGKLIISGHLPSEHRWRFFAQ